MDKSPYSDYAPEQEDAWHDGMAALILIAIPNGVYVPPNPNNRFQLTFLCNECPHSHSITGSLPQIQHSITAMVCAGYPWFEVKDLAWLEFEAMHSDAPTPEERLERTRADYEAFCEQHRSG